MELIVHLIIGLTRVNCAFFSLQVRFRARYRALHVREGLSENQRYTLKTAVWLAPFACTKREAGDVRC